MAEVERLTVGLLQQFPETGSGTFSGAPTIFPLKPD
jgi:hypothetical protein